MRRWRINAALAVALIGGSVVALQSGVAQAATTPEEIAIARANEAIRSHPDLFQVSDGDTFTVWRANVTRGGAAHVRFTREFRGLPVLGGDFVVHLAADGGLDGASLTLARPVGVDVAPKVDAAAAAKAAREALRAREVGTPTLAVDAVGGTGVLAWDVPVTLEEGTAEAVVSAVDGTVLRSARLEQEVAGTGNSVYSGTVTIQTTLQGGQYKLIDPTRGNATTCNLNHAMSGTCTTFSDANNVWGDGNPATDQSAAVDVAYGAASAFDYYKNVLGRNGVFDNGVGITSRVHRGVDWVNARWNSTAKVMEYGDGAGGIHPLVSLDVAGHEMSHGVTQGAVPPGGLIYSGESGGLNESTSDIFGTMTEFYANNPQDTPDYLLGEEIDIFGTGEPLRYMYDPDADGISKNCYYNGVGNLDPHYSSGVANHLYFLLAEGSGQTAYGTSPTCDGSSLVGIGRDKAAKIWYNALNNYFTSGETFAQARQDTIAAATELYGKCSSATFAVARAWAAVNVGQPLSWIPCLKIFHLVWIEWPRNPIPDPGPLKWVTTVQEKGVQEVVEVGVHISHARRGDLQIDLVSPSGRSYRLKSADREDRGVDVDETYPVRLGQALEPGEWTLVVEDTVKGGSGRLLGWTLLY
ncbi:peptidase M4 [Catellatospora sp. TT07R-123]|uniref:M4 family metallopeptidase n=1 Tax=Catellatospora sp. TT07R-123 TaxID=2733863 RepID=UPI001B23DCF8|nr:M4 family metallopeptidase [Catellatospora sp. TT07R-123]GHJ47850.1 peptidase M4 [Catellatospora sp. TT07R-123]